MRTFVNNLINRELNRKKTTGFTKYILYSILVTFFYKIVIMLPNIPILENFWKFLLVLTYSINFYFGIVIIKITYQANLSKYTPLRVFKRSLFANSFLLFIIILIPSLLVLFLNTIILFHFGNFNWYHFLIVVVSLILFIFNFFVMDISKKKEKNSFFLLFGSEQSNTDYNIYPIIFYLVSFTIIIFSLKNIFFQSIPTGNLNIFIFSLLLYSIPLLLIILLSLKEEENLFKSLENFELEIYILDLSDKDIKNELQKNYFGYILSEWLKHQTILLANSKLNFENKINNLENKIIKFNNTTKDQQSEINKDFIKKMYSDLKIEINIFFEGKNKEIKELIKDRKLNNVEKFEFTEFSQKLNNELNKYETATNKVYKSLGNK